MRFWHETQVDLENEVRVTGYWVADARRGLLNRVTGGLQVDLENEVLDATKALKESHGVTKHWLSKFEALKVEYAQDQVIPNPERQR